MGPVYLGEDELEGFLRRLLLLPYLIVRVSENVLQVPIKSSYLSKLNVWATHQGPGKG